MSTVIIYSTKHGCVEKCTQRLEDLLSNEVIRHNLKETPAVDLSQYETVIIGGSIYMGQIQKDLKQFCLDNLEVLKTKRLGLFICCMYEGEIAQKQLAEAFPRELIQAAAATAVFGGEFSFDKLGFLEKLIVKKVAKVDHSVTSLSEDHISSFADKMESK